MMKSPKYQPPFSITPEIFNGVAAISKIVGRLTIFADQALWQSLILAHWNPLFANLPVENLILEHQAEYYQALQNSSTEMGRMCVKTRWPKR